MVIRGHLGALPKKIHPNRPKGSGEKQRKTEKVGVFLLFFEDSAVPEGRILMRTKKLDSPGNFTLENIYPTVCRAFRAGYVPSSKDKVGF